MIAVVGAGSWGTALAIHLARGGATVRVCARTAAVAEAITKRRRNPWYLSDLEIPPGVEATSDPEQAVSTARLGPRKSKEYDSRLASIVIRVMSSSVKLA